MRHLIGLAVTASLLIAWLLKLDDEATLAPSTLPFAVYAALLFPFVTTVFVVIRYPAFWLLRYLARRFNGGSNA